MFGLFKGFRRKRLLRKPFPKKWKETLSSCFPYYQNLTQEEKERLHQKIKIFLDEKSFQGAQGFQITDDVRVIIAAQACLLILNIDDDYFENLNHIVVYPETYVSREPSYDESGFVSTAPQVRSGESWSFGTIVLAWSDIIQGARDPHDGQNLIYHEFAHQLDQESGSSNGAPLFKDRSFYTAWAQVFQKNYDQLIEDTHAKRKTVLDKYGSTNPAEFFAVCTEAFFEKPVQLRREHPELYDQLKKYYRQDPAHRI